MTHNHYADPEQDDGEGWTQSEARNTPVDAEKCVRCKIPHAEATVDFVDLSTGESLCKNCLRYQREFKRALYFDFIFSNGLEPAVQRIANDYGSAVAAELEALYDDDDEIERISKRFHNATGHTHDRDPPYGDS